MSSVQCISTLAVIVLVISAYAGLDLQLDRRQRGYFRHRGTISLERSLRLVCTTELVQCALAKDRIKVHRSAYRMSALVAIRSTCWCRSRHVT